MLRRNGCQEVVGITEKKRLEDKLAEMREQEEKRYEKERQNGIVKEEREKYRKELRQPPIAIRVIMVLLMGFWMLIVWTYKGIRWLYQQTQKD